MPIITIYQGASGEGRELSEAVARALGYRCIGREALVERGHVTIDPFGRLDHELARLLLGRHRRDLRVVITATNVAKLYGLAPTKGTIAVGGDAVEVGLVTAAYALLPLAIAVSLGRFTDRAARIAWLAGLGSVVLAVGGLFLAGAGGLLGLALASTVVGVGHLLCMVAAQALIARHSRPEHLDRDFGWFTAAASLGQLAGPLISGAVLADASGPALLAATSTALLIAGVIAALGALPLLPLARLRPPRRTAEQRAAPPVPTRDLLRRPRMPSALLTSLALLTAVDILTAYLPLIAESRGISPMLVGVLLSLRAGSSLLSRLTLPWMLRRWSRRALVITSTGVAAVALTLVALPLGGFAALAAVLAVGVMRSARTRQG